MLQIAPGDLHSRSRVNKIMILLVESGFIYCLFWVSLPDLRVFSRKSNLTTGHPDRELRRNAGHGYILSILRFKQNG